MDVEQAGSSSKTLSPFETRLRFRNAIAQPKKIFFPHFLSSGCTKKFYANTINKETSWRYLFLFCSFSFSNISVPSYIRTSSAGSPAFSIWTGKPVVSSKATPSACNATSRDSLKLKSPDIKLVLYNEPGWRYG